MTTVTPTQLAAELHIDPKRLRAYLRKEYARSPEQKNTSWAIPATVANGCRKHFVTKPDATLLERASKVLS